MARMTTPSNTKTAPRWAAQVMDANTMIPGGARLVAADFTADSAGMKRVAAGTCLGRTRAERDAGTGLSPWVTGDEEVFLIAFDVIDAATNADVELYRPGSMVYENQLPGWSGLSAGLKAAIRATYQCIVSKEVTV
jgi:hypothetical protein